ncbi:MAG: hypothetical protein RSA52_10490 [Acetivibrio sp.]
MFCILLLIVYNQEKEQKRTKGKQRSEEYEVDIQTGRGLPSSEPKNQKTARGGNREIRNDAGNLSNGEQTRLVLGNESRRDIAPASYGYRQGILDNEREYHQAVIKRESRSEQRDGSDGLGETPEFTYSSSGGGNSSRLDIQLSLFPSESEQKYNIERNQKGALTAPFLVTSKGKTTEEKDSVEKQENGTERVSMPDKGTYKNKSVSVGCKMHLTKLELCILKNSKKYLAMMSIYLCLLR